MLKRTITAVLCVLLLIPVCIYSDDIIFPIVLSIICFIATYEVLNCMKLIKLLYISIPFLALSVCSPFMARYIKPIDDFIIYYFFVFFLILVYLLIVSVLTSSKTSITENTAAFGICIYVIFGFSSIIIMRDMENGIYLYLLPIVGPWICDIFALICGKMFGKHKLIPSISPHKTVEGSIGGIVFCVIFSIIYNSILVNVFHIQTLGTLFFVICGVIIAAISQFGDLIASVIKRKYNFKDYGYILPGHGGILDRFDSVISTCSIVMIYYYIIQNLG